MQEDALKERVARADFQQNVLAEDRMVGPLLKHLLELPAEIACPSYCCLGCESPDSSRVATFAHGRLRSAPVPRPRQRRAGSSRRRRVRWLR